LIKTMTNTHRHARFLLIALGSSLAAVYAQKPFEPQASKNVAAHPIVAEVRSHQVLVGNAVRPAVVNDMFTWALTTLTGRRTVADAWRSFIPDGAVVGIKLDRYGAETIGTTPVIVQTILRSLTTAGVKPDQVMLIDADPIFASETQTLGAPFGWGEAGFDVGAGDDHFAAALERVDVLINVSFLKQDNVCGMSACMKNVTLHFIQHPVQYFRDDCSPFIGAILNQPALRPKLRLNLVDALRIVYDEGPVATETNVHGAGSIILGFDPVAVDTVALELLNQIRSDRNLPVVGGADQSLDYIISAGSLGLGVPYIESIDHRQRDF
jgi:hypothetical protein